MVVVAKEKSRMGSGASKFAPAARRLLLPSGWLIGGLTLSAVLFASVAGQTTGTPTAEGVAYDTMIPATDEGRARFSNIFVAEVVGVAGEDKLPTNDPKDFIRIIYYDVEVEQTLKGDATGRVRIRYDGADDRSPDAPGARELRVGERILFAAGDRSDEGWYPVSAGLGVVPIENDAEAAALMAKYERLIPAVEQQQRSAAAAADPCEQVGVPTIDVQPRRGAPGEQVRITGTNFVRPEVSIWWDGTKTRLATADVGADCTVTKNITIPRAEPGEHRIIVQDAREERAEATIEVTRN